MHGWVVYCHLTLIFCIAALYNDNRDTICDAAYETGITCIDAVWERHCIQVIKLYDPANKDLLYLFR